MIEWFLSLLLLMWFITFIDFRMLNHPSMRLLFSHCPFKGQFCEWLSEAAAHLPAAVSLLLLQALLIADLRSELNTHLALKALFI
jgi:hypothetical protein